MKSLVAYDSAHGNTEKIAKSIHTALSKHGSCSVKHVSTVNDDDLHDLDLLVIGSPTQAGRPTKPTQELIDQLSTDVLNAVDVAVFDTRFEVADQKLSLRILMKTIGYAADKMVKSIKHSGGNTIVDPIGFTVIDMKGPLKKGEEERATAWADQLVSSIK